MSNKPVKPKQRKSKDNDYEQRQLAVGNAMYRRRVPIEFHPLLDDFMAKLKRQAIKKQSKGIINENTKRQG